MTPRILASWPHYEAEEIAAAQRAIQTGRVNYWTGSQGRQFEAELALSCQCNHAVVVANGALALKLALQAADIRHADEVIITPHTATESLQSVLDLGATPVFADIDSRTENLSRETLEAALSSRTRAVIAFHHAGWPCDMDGIMEIAAEHDVTVIEDCSQAQGAQYKGRPAGSLGHVAVLSFCGDKITTTGGAGGAVVTNDHDLWERAWSYKDHGKNSNSISCRATAPGFRWLHDSLGTNWRLTEMQSAIGRIQLQKLQRWSERRSEIASQFKETLQEFDCVDSANHLEGSHRAYYRVVCHVDNKKLHSDWNRDRIASELRTLGLPVSSGFDFNRGENAKNGIRSAFIDKPTPVADKLNKTRLAISLHPNLTANDIQHVCDSLRHVLTLAASRSY
ncbi:MAG: DegT/DnrJ/EryC1/StrS family aminotransferase [Gammaproteobacteria bacterium]